MSGLTPVPLSTGLARIPPAPAPDTPTTAPTPAPSPDSAPAARNTININMNQGICTFMEGRNDLQIRSLFNFTMCTPLTDSKNGVCCTNYLKETCFANFSCASNNLKIPTTDDNPTINSSIVR